MAGTVVLTTCAVQGLLPPEDLLPTRGDDPVEDPVEDRSAVEETAPPEAEPRCTLAAEVDPVALRGTDGSLDVPGAVTAGTECVEQVVLVVPGDAALAAIAAPLAAAAGAPLLIGDEAELADVLASLGDPEVRLLERTDERADAAADDGTGVAVRVAEELGATTFVAAPTDEPNLLAGAGQVAIRTGAAVLPVDRDGPPPQLPPAAEVVTIGDLGDRFPDAVPAEAPWELDGDGGPAWLVDPADPAALPTIVLAALRGDEVVPVSGGDLLARRTVARVRGAGLDASSLVPVGTFAGDPGRDVVLLAEAPLLPGGTLRHFDGTRMVALYGRPDSTVLGALGEQDLDATFERVREVSAGYDADGREVVPTLEVIVTVASAEAGDDGNYSRVTPPEEFRDLVDRAGEEGMQVILDLQPGRTDFLTQARIYEELLREPHVGLALDPEWRLEPDQVHLRQIGSVDAAEVQAVVDWYAELARDTGVAEKLLVLHQFRLSMLPDRDTIEAPREVAVVIHMDGQGPQGTKLETWRTLTAGAEDRWHWAWKNFYDEDPVVAQPEYILDLEPEVVLVTYQ
ncbi:hypothetical protein [Nitriliruptor alkaliphilus]|uniref:hypothetical protein n=1 Tax=Nitriliruptor alkaliphilus TaxID=427918 RepID=UPI000A6859CD|nr:hypothetical protein [Nitriliruptor alkaliphilus]